MWTEPTASSRLGAALEAQAVSAGYVAGGTSRAVVHDITASVRSGDLICLLGINGAGKSTLMRTLIGAQPPVAGRVSLGGTAIDRLSAGQRARRLAVLLTDRIDVPLMKVEEIVALGRSPHLGWFARLSEEDHRIVHRSLVRVGAEGFVGRQLSELSDGERQRVMLARALAQEPEILILDEPMAFLDLIRRVELMGLLRDLARGGLAVLLSIHDVELAVRCADTLWVIQPDGTLDCGAPEDLACGGRIGAAFENGRVAFQHETGGFAIAPSAGARTAIIVATGTEALWARRAAERAGLAVVSHGDADIVITRDPEASAWRVADGSRHAVCATLRDLVTFVRGGPDQHDGSTAHESHRIDDRLAGDAGADLERLGAGQPPGVRR